MSILPSQNILAQVSDAVGMLQSAVNVGDMDGVDTATSKLMELTTDCQSLDMTEEEWRAFLNGIRIRNPEFQSNYLLPGELCTDIFPAVSAHDFVLELPIDGNPGEEGGDV